MIMQLAITDTIVIKYLDFGSGNIWKKSIYNVPIKCITHFINSVVYNSVFKLATSFQ